MSCVRRTCSARLCCLRMRRTMAPPMTRTTSTPKSAQRVARVPEGTGSYCGGPSLTGLRFESSFCGVLGCGGAMRVCRMPRPADEFLTLHRRCMSRRRLAESCRCVGGSEPECGKEQPRPYPHTAERPIQIPLVSYFSLRPYRVVTKCVNSRLWCDPNDSWLS